MEKQPIALHVVTVRWVAESSMAGWPCTLLRVTYVGPQAVEGEMCGTECCALPSANAWRSCPQGESGQERLVQSLQLPCWEPGHALPATTLLPFLAAVGQCFSGDTEKPGTLLSHSRCCWTRVWGSRHQRPLIVPPAGPHVS